MGCTQSNHFSKELPMPVKCPMSWQQEWLCKKRDCFTGSGPRSQEQQWAKVPPQRLTPAGLCAVHCIWGCPSSALSTSQSSSNCHNDTDESMLFWSLEVWGASKSSATQTVSGRVAGHPKPDLTAQATPCSRLSHFTFMNKVRNSDVCPPPPPTSRLPRMSGWEHTRKNRERQLLLHLVIMTMWYQWLENHCKGHLSTDDCPKKVCKTTTQTEQVHSWFREHTKLIPQSQSKELRFHLLACILRPQF